MSVLPLLYSMLVTAGVHDYLLFHTLNGRNALKVLTTDTLKLPLSDTNSSEKNPLHKKVKTYYLSLARTVASGYIADRASGLRKVNHHVLFVFHAKKLVAKRGVRVSPVEYWTGERTDGRLMGNAREAEERLFSSQPEVKGIRKTLKEVRLFLREDEYNDRELLAVYSFCLKAKIPVKLFTEKNLGGYKLGKEKAEDRTLAKEWLFKLPKNLVALPSHNDHNSFRVKDRQYGKQDHYDMSLLIEQLYRKKTRNELSKRAREILSYSVDRETRNSAIRNLTTQFESDVHNYRNTDDRHAKPKERLARLMHQTKSKTTRDLYGWIYDKWSMDA